MSVVEEQGESPRQPWGEVIDQVNGSINVAAKLGPGLGGTCLLSYAINEKFFPELIGTITLQTLAFVGFVSIFVLTVGLGLGILFAYSFLAPVARLSIRRGKRKTSSILPSTRVARWLWWIGSAMFAALVVTIELSSYTRTRDISAYYMSGYFVAAGFMILGVTGDSVSSVRLKATWCLIIPFAMLAALPQAIPRLVALPMSLMGFRSSPRDLVIIKGSIYKQLIDQAHEAGETIDSCLFVDGDGTKSKRLLMNVVVVWRGVGTTAFLRAVTTSAGQPATLSLPSSDITVLDGSSKRPCA